MALADGHCRHLCTSKYLMQGHSQVGWHWRERWVETLLADRCEGVTSAWVLQHWLHLHIDAALLP
jgi:hypothetical protein